MRRALGILILGVAGLAVIGGTGAWWLRADRDNQPTFRTVPVKRGDLVATINATGTVEPEEVVDVGAQVAGLISAFGTDKNGKTDRLRLGRGEGTVLARIDDTLYAADVESAKAQLQQAQANLISADANVLQMKPSCCRPRRTGTRAQKLGPSEALAPTAYDQYKANYEVAKANLGWPRPPWIRPRRRWRRPKPRWPRRNKTSAIAPSPPPWRA